MDIEAADIRAQIDRISASPDLAHSTRLQEILNYISEEFIAGRGDRIKGFTIGEAIFSSDETFDSTTNSIVRVEMGRLRRRLTEYYLTMGRHDPIIVDVPKGSYIPRFKLNPQATRLSESSLSEYHPNLKLNRNPILAGVALVIIIFLALIWRYFGAQEDVVSSELNGSETINISEESEAQILFKQAFNLLMPPEDSSRLASSQSLFQRVIELDESFGGGYAGKSIALSFSILFIKSEDVPGDLLQAMAFAKDAVDNDPDFSLGYAALALTQCLNRETDDALGNTRRVISTRPHDGKANVIAAIAFIVCGVPSMAIDLVIESLTLDPNNARTPYLNILSIAQYLNGNYSEAEKSIKNNLARKGPSGPHMDVFLAAIYAQMGKNYEAQAVIEKLELENPGYPVEKWLGNFIRSEGELRELVDKLQSLGLSS